MGFLAGVFNDCEAVGLDGGQDGVDSGPYGVAVHVDVGADKVVGFYVYHAALFQGDFGTQGLKGLDVQVDRAHAQIAAAGHCHAGPAKTAQQDTQEIVGRAVEAGHFIGDLGFLDMLCINHHSGAVNGLYHGPNVGEDFQNDGNIADVRDIFDDTGFLGQDCCSQDGNSRVFCAADGDFSHQPATALDDKSFHGDISFCYTWRKDRLQGHFAAHSRNFE